MLPACFVPPLINIAAASGALYECVRLFVFVLLGKTTAFVSHDASFMPPLTVVVKRAVIQIKHAEAARGVAKEKQICKLRTQKGII